MSAYSAISSSIKIYALSTDDTPSTPDDALVQRPPEPSELPEEQDYNLVQYNHEQEKEYLGDIRTLISRDLSEPYSIYVYRYFLNNWPNLCWMVLDKNADPQSNKHRLLGVVVCKLDRHRSGLNRGYIAMLAVEIDQRKRGFGSLLVQRAITTMQEQGADEVVLETEDINKASLRLYERLGFVPTKHLHRYYLNGNGAMRLALYLTDVKTKLMQRTAAQESGNERVTLGSEDSFDDYDDYDLHGGGEGSYDDELYS